MVVTPGAEATTTLAVRNNSDIVEAYVFEVVGECAPWTTVEPARLSLYPGTAETVTVRLRPPRSPAVRAGEVPLGVRVLPAERPETAVVSETTVRIEPFGQLRAELAPRRRRAWRSARYRVELHNEGNTPVAVALTTGQAEEQLRFGFPAAPTVIEPGAQADVGLRARVRKLIWFGKPVERPFHLTATPATEQPIENDPPLPVELDGELVQLPLLPRWLLAVLAALLALLLAWFALARPLVRSAARQAADDRTKEIAQTSPLPSNGPGPGAPSGKPQGGGGSSGNTGGGNGQGPGGGTGGDTGGGIGPGQQASNTVEVRTGRGARRTGIYRVPEGKIFRITDILVANPQGDEGLITITFGDRTITTIALETFRNQDYHWVTPIDVPENATVTAAVTCGNPGTPASGRQAANCLELLNVNGELSDVVR